MPLNEKPSTWVISDTSESVTAPNPVPQTPAPAPATNPPAASTSIANSPVAPPAPATSATDSANSSTISENLSTVSTMPNPRSASLRSPAEIDLAKFNRLVGDWAGQDLESMERLFVKTVILEDGSKIDVETIKVPGFIGIADATKVTDASGQSVSGHEDIAKVLERDGLLICTYQWHKERYGTPFDLRQTMGKELFTEGFIKNEGHHSGAVVPAQRLIDGQRRPSYATFNEPDDYHRGLYGKDGYVAIAQRLVFSSFVTAKQARDYTDSILNWMVMLNPVLQFPSNYNGGDPVHVTDRASLKALLKNALLANLGDATAIAFFKDPANLTYCAEFMFVALNTPLYPFNLKGLTKVLDGDTSKAKQILAMQESHNQRKETPLSRKHRNPEFKAMNIAMPVISENLLPLDELLAKNGQSVATNSLPFPPFKISQVIRRAFRTLLPRQQFGDAKVAKAQAALFKGMEPALIEQLGLSDAPASDPKVQGVKAYIELVSEQLGRSFASYAEFDQTMDQLMVQADEMLVGAGDRTYFVPPRVYVDLGQNDGDNNLPVGWGFHLEAIGALVARSVIK
jgi:hypothetical protein